MEILWHELSFGVPESDTFERVLIRLIAAAILGGAIGVERQRAGKSAGLRTHMLVTVATTTLLLACTEFHMTSDGMSRVIQGIVTGIGFLGAGTIIKLESEMDVKGLTTAAGIWMAAAIGATVGLGALGIAVVSTILALLILTVTVALDNWIGKGRVIKKRGRDNKVEEDKSAPPN